LGDVTFGSLKHVRKDGSVSEREDEGADGEEQL
jgi:hypothetical protein